MRRNTENGTEEAGGGAPFSLKPIYSLRLLRQRIPGISPGPANLDIAMPWLCEGTPRYIRHPTPSTSLNPDTAPTSTAQQGGHLDVDRGIQPQLRHKRHWVFGSGKEVLGLGVLRFPARSPSLNHSCSHRGSMGFILEPTWRYL